MAETPERDVATRLRDYREVDRDGYLEQSAPGWMSEAADLITRLSRELAEAREALAAILRHVGTPDAEGYDRDSPRGDVYETARAALSSTGKTEE